MVALVVPLVLAAGCGGEQGPAPGADPAKVGPQPDPNAAAAVVPAAVPPSPAPSAAASPTPSPTSAAGQLQESVATALAGVDPAAGTGVTLDVRPSAGNQLVVEWTVSRDPDDPAAKTRLRQEAIAVLAAVRPQASPYGSVLLIADATARDGTGHAVGTKALRAKYSRALIQRTDFTAVSLDRILTLPDDKSAVIDPAFR